MHSLYFQVEVSGVKKQLLCSPQAVEDDACGANCISFPRLVMTAILAVVTAACTDLSVP